MSTKPIIALVIIARDEAICIERCLLSAKPYVDRMIVLDTGSTDNTVLLAEACGAQVHHFRWIDDFSAARNAALDAADADLNLIMDADEWLEHGGEQLHTIVSAPAVVGLVCIKNDTGAADSASRLVSWLPRLLPRGVRYTGRIHEQPVSTLPVQRTSVIFGHDGYTDEKMRKKRGRNTRLLREELARNPNDPYVLFQLGKELELHDDDYAQAAELYTKAYEHVPPQALYRQNLALHLLYCLGKADRMPEAMAHADACLQIWPDVPDLCFALGLILIDAAAKHPAQAGEQWLPMAEQAFTRCLEIGDRPDLDGSVIGRGSFLAAHSLATVYQMQSSALASKSEHFRALSDQLRNTPHPADAAG
ncbi:glycosyltransferase [Ralstonia insidiosa]|uniref:Glycosyltransferase n=1 Tax=Ralstonia insidiosa TaxID=190721 RepID=A0A848P172_9RALS|nr:glycosyltransferase [Ralstonia insidiosa]NMV39277.1 glycosyltransferase [Ralstonia insidiosa]